MRKVVTLLIFLSLLVSAVSAQEEKPIITVLDFNTESVSQSEMTTIISLLSSTLFQTDLFTVIDVSQRQNILSEIEFSAGGCTDESCMLEIGRLLAAEMIVVGSLSKIGSRYVLSSKLLETQTGKTLGTADGIYADLDTMLDDLSPFSHRLVKSVSPDVKMAEEPAPQPAEKPAPASTEPVAEPESEPTPSPEIVEAPAPKDEPKAVDGKKILGFSLTGLGVVAAGVGGYLIYDAFAAVDKAWADYENATVDDNFETLYTVYESALDNRKPAFILGTSIAGGGLLLSAVGTILLIPKKDAKVQVAAAVVPAPQALSMLVSLHF